MIVVDASAALSALLNAGTARSVLAAEQVHVPHLVDTEVASGLRRHVRMGTLTGDQGWSVLDTWRRLGLTRHPVAGLLGRMWELRDNFSTYDASYVALAEILGCGVVTADGRLGRAPGARCPVTVLPR